MTERRREYLKNYRETHREQYKEYQRKYMKAHRQHIYALQKSWRDKNPDKMKQYYFNQWKKEMENGII